MNKDIVPELLIKNSLLENKEQRGKIARGLDGVPVNKMYEQCQYLQNVVLPTIEEKSGQDSENYKYWFSVSQSLLWAIVVMDRYESLLLRLSRVETLCQFYRDMEEKANRELQKFHTLEELILTDSLERHVEAIGKKVNDLLTKK